MWQDKGGFHIQQLFPDLKNQNWADSLKRLRKEVDIMFDIFFDKFEKFWLYGIKKFTLVEVLVVQLLKGLLLGLLVFDVALIFFHANADIFACVGICIVACVCASGISVLD